MELPETTSIFSGDGENILVDEAEAAFSTGESTGDRLESTGGNDFPPIEFYYGKVMKDGKWQKTGKLYWIFVIWEGGERRRRSPTYYYGKVKGITSADRCPFQGRLYEFSSRSLSIPKSTGDSTGVVRDDNGPAGSDEATPGLPNHQ